MVQSINDVLEERGTRYGVFMGQAQIAQSIHIVLEQGMKLSGKTRFDFTPDELEAINMIVNKIGRIYNGDPHYSDSWRDIAGYATLVADRLDNDSQKLIEAKEEDDRTRNTADVETNRGGDVESEPIHPANGGQVRHDNRPSRLPELRRLPVRLEVQDGNHISTTETQPGVPAAPRG